MKNKVEKYILDNTRNCSNEITQYYSDLEKHYHPWLTPDHARKCAEIAKEDVIEKACKWLKSCRKETLDGTGYIYGVISDKTIEDFCKAMEGN